MVITEAGCDDRVTQLLYVASVMPEAGQSQAELIGSEPAPWMLLGDDGTVGVRPDLVRKLFLQDCDEATTEQALDRLTRQSITPSRNHRVRSPGRSARRTSSARRTLDPAEVQRRRVKEGARLVEFPAGHHRFLSRPEAFASSIAAEIDRVC